MYLVGKINKDTNGVDYHSICKDMNGVKAIVMRWAMENKLDDEYHHIGDDRDVLIEHRIGDTLIDRPYQLAYRNQSGMHLYGVCFAFTADMGEDISTAIDKLQNMKSTICPIEIVLQIHDEVLTIGYATSPAAAKDIINQVHLPAIDGARVDYRTNPKYNSLDKSRAVVLCDAIKTMLQNDSGMLL